MGRIHLLSDILASQVAAGEVVERPASVVKELLENSIDAGATHIELDVQQGGRELIRLLDNGSGMEREDALLALERHATSKIRSAEDLHAIETLGFRGEALPSIASVSRFSLRTIPQPRESGELPLGSEIVIEGGVIQSQSDVGGASGTVIEVRDLFFNVPARRKFLKSVATESRHILEQMQSVAIAYPQVGMICRKDQKEVFQLPATTQRVTRLHDLLGAAFLERLEEISPIEVEGVAVEGFVAKPGEGNKDRSGQFFFVNGRRVFSPILSQPLRESYDGILAKGLYPPAVLFITLPLSEVDCNVHPAKREVRFQKPGLIKEAIGKAVISVLGETSFYSGFQPLAASNWSTEKTSFVGEAPFFQHQNQDSSQLRDQFKDQNRDPINASVISPKGALGKENFVLTTLSYHQTDATQSENGMSLLDNKPPGEAKDRLLLDKCASPLESNPMQKALPWHEGTTSSWSYLGCLAKRYLLFEAEEESLALVSLKAALERISYDTIQASWHQGSLECQRLLLPEIITFSPAHADWLLALEKPLLQSGFELHDFGASSPQQGGRTLKLDTIPTLLADIKIQEFPSLLTQLVEEISEETSLSSFQEQTNALLEEKITEKIIRSLSCMAAHTHFLPSQDEEALLFLKELLDRPQPYITPSGKPTMIEMAAPELKRRFSRAF